MTETQFKLSIPNSHQQYLHVELIVRSISDQTEIFLPTWRPGRYELGNFAKNIKAFKVFSDKNKVLYYKKTSKHCWSIDSKDTKYVRIQYQYYSAELNAGSTFVNNKLLYVNPVNCLIYSKEQFNNPIKIDFEIPENWLIASSLKHINKRSYSVESFDELFDTPVICSPHLVSKTYEVNGSNFIIWFNDLAGIDWDRLVKDFKKFTQKQIDDFGEFPNKEFHFLIHTPNYPLYHGVEHLKSTVIALGPKYDVFGKLYSELLGVSSHELYHVWNVKSIRPYEMKPYNFESENYSKLGYVYEGVTTYLGDLYLLKSGVFSLNSYLKELERQFQKHFDNHGRFNYSVGESSYDTWLDGYVKGVPGRKVSIYVEGCLLAFVTDFMIRKANNNKIGLERVMKQMYYHPDIVENGYQEATYREILESVSSISFKELFDNYVNGIHSYEGILTDALDYFGLELSRTPSPSYAESVLGIKTIQNKDKTRIIDISPGSPADMSGLTLGDEIIAVNNTMVNKNLDKWLKYFDGKTHFLQISRNNELINLDMPTLNRTFFQIIKIQVKKEASDKQIKARQSWGCLDGR
ncbi:MAG: PDZ domain-containing protein [Crocinitomicaceae bacterium]|nr:PDZ domain-containing protein [Crocinitomicaceae bacterium]